MTETRTPSRFVDKGEWLMGLASSSVCVCPKCKGPVLVSSESPVYARNARATCLSCSFRIAPGEKIWLGPLLGRAKQRCRNCGYKWLQKAIRYHASRKQQKSTSLTCPSCGLVNSLPVVWRKPGFVEGIEPIFGLPLWLRTSCCGETLWAFNREHVATLRGYIQATLRERIVTTRGTLGRLPQWMTAAKNREAVLAGLRRLEKKLDTVEALQSGVKA